MEHDFGHSRLLEQVKDRVEHMCGQMETRAREAEHRVELVLAQQEACVLRAVQDSQRYDDLQ